MNMSLPWERGIALGWKNEIFHAMFTSTLYYKVIFSSAGSEENTDVVSEFPHYCLFAKTSTFSNVSATSSHILLKLDI